MLINARSQNTIRAAVLGIACCLFVQTNSAWSQVRELHTRDATRLSEVQVIEQLKHSDVIFIPVGSVETNGIMPSDRDYVSALGYAMAMAEETGGLYMPGLVHSFPGTTVMGSSSIRMTPTQGAAGAKKRAIRLRERSNCLTEVCSPSTSCGGSATSPMSLGATCLFPGQKVLNQMLRPARPVRTMGRG